MKLMNIIIQFTSQRKLHEFEDAKDLEVILIGVPFFVFSCLIGYYLNKFISAMINATATHGISVSIGVWWLAIAFLACVFWVFSCIATRCHSMLYERWFK